MPRRLAALLLALLATGLATAGAADARPVPAGFFGVMVNGPAIAPGFDLAAEARAMRAAGVRSWRVEMPWDSVEPARGTYAWAQTDREVAAAALGGMRVLGLVVRAPAWASGSSNPFVPPRRPSDYAAFVTALVARYGPHGSLWAENPGLPRRPVREWQIWNEPNIRVYFARQPFAKPYAALLRAAYKAVKRADPGATVVMAGLANFSWRDLAKAYAAGVRRWFDVAAVHPFSGRPANTLKIARLNRSVMNRSGDRRKPLWVTEYTWSSGKGKTRNHTVKGWETTEAGQARRLRAGYRLLIGDRRALRLRRVYWYTWASVDRRSANSFDYSGLRKLTPDGTLRDKPALAAFRTMVRRYTR
ncbi:MAG TPA: hypothetical protein VLB47_07450 [Solirubrobacteraceae bacterium]|nr:hypothetical protein [Solirubrobacteraceae bacterium]